MAPPPPCRGLFAVWTSKVLYYFVIFPFRLTAVNVAYERPDRFGRISFQSSSRCATQFLVRCGFHDVPPFVVLLSTDMTSFDIENLPKGPKRPTQRIILSSPEGTNS